MSEPLMNESGKVYGKLTVLNKWRSVQSKSGLYNIEWFCECSCGNKKWLKGSNLRANRVHSCGCLRRENPNWGQKPIEKDSKYFFKNWFNIWERKSTLAGKIFTLTLEELDLIYEKQKGLCFYTGEELILANSARNCMKETNISIDRIDNDKGYELDNIVLCSKMVNISRNTYTQQEFITMCRCVANNQSLNHILNCELPNTRTRQKEPKV